MNIRPFLFAPLLGLVVFQVHADNPKALPVTATAKPLAGNDAPKALPVDNAPPPNARVAAPAFVNSITFKVLSDGETRILTVVSGPTIVRIDIPTDRLSVIYNPQTEYYIGLEHSNYTYWDFSWPDVRDQVQSSQRYAARLRDIGPEALNSEPDSSAPSDTNAPPASATAGTDDSGYVWHSTLEKKRIDDIDCTHWIGQTLAGENIDAWCANGPIPSVDSAVGTLRAINEPMALVPVRNLVPPLVFVAWDAMTKGGVTPVLIAWGGGSEQNRFALTGQKGREGRIGIFEVPKAYMKTTLITMDGIGNQKPPGARAHREEINKPEQSRIEHALQ